ncbi:MAG: toxic anion resistance protein, partial [Pseudomonadota bacterium]
RIVQENDKGLVNKINSTMTNTIPLWRQQLAVAVSIARAEQAGKAVKSASDLTNELLAENAELLNQSNKEIRQQLERGVFDIETVKEANQKLILTIEESLQIADEGKRMRANAVKELSEMENALKQTLTDASARSAGA